MLRFGQDYLDQGATAYEGEAHPLAHPGIQTVTRRTALKPLGDKGLSGFETETI